MNLNELSTQYSFSAGLAVEHFDRPVDVGGVSSFQDNNNAISHLHAVGVSRAQIVLPWETPLMSQIFGSQGPSLSLNMPANWSELEQPFGASPMGLGEPDIPSADHWTCARYVKHT